MPYERLVGLYVSDDVAYAQYRQAMMPILERYGGTFRYDFKVAEVLHNEGGKPINRVFVIAFGDKDSHDRFFADPTYQDVRQAHFDRAVTAATVVSSYHRVDGQD